MQVGSGSSPVEESGNPLQYSCLENSMDRRAWGCYSPWGPKGSDTTEHPHRHSHTHGRRVSHEYLSYRWGSSDLKNQMYFTIPFSICESVVHFSLLMENGTTKFIQNLTSDTCEFKCWLRVPMPGYITLKGRGKKSGKKEEQEGKAGKVLSRN